MLNILSKVSKKERKKKKNHRQKKTPQNKTHNQNRPQQENVSSSVWMEIKSRVEKNKNKHPKISHKWGGGGGEDGTGPRKPEQRQTGMGKYIKQQEEFRSTSKRFSLFWQSLKKTQVWRL